MNALDEAHFVYSNLAILGPEQRREAAVSLSEYGIFSRRGIASLTGLTMREVASVVNKTDRTGGKIVPDALGDVIALRDLRERGEMDVFLARRVLGQMSAAFVSRLTGIPAATLTRWKMKADTL